jgi:tetratricopeptide (TPR) repeat protein
MDPDEIADAYVREADGLAAAGRFDDAIALYDRAIEVCPEAPESWTGKANILKMQGRLPEALECLESALAISPSPIAEMLRNNLVEELKSKGLLRRSS